MVLNAVRAQQGEFATQEVRTVMELASRRFAAFASADGLGFICEVNIHA